MIDAYAITLYGDQTSEHGFNVLCQSSEHVKNDFDIRKFAAVTADTVDEIMNLHSVKWNYPWQGEVIDFDSGLTKTAYKTKDPKKRMACFMSHYLLWFGVKDSGRPALILEHDAIFTQQFGINDIAKTPFCITGINLPLGATRRARDFYLAINNHPNKFQQVPVIDKLNIPQGLAGNSAYFITPEGAEIMLKLTERYGAWPNDALMCRQLVKPFNLGVTKTFYTTIQGLKSTTTQ